MFCTNCGTEIQDSMKYCPKCGKKTILSDISSPASEEIVRDNNGFNRDVLVLYFGQVRTMECSVAALEHKLANLNYKIANLGLAGNIPKPTLRENYTNYNVGDNLYMVFFFLGCCLVSNFLYDFISWGLFRVVSGLSIIAMICYIGSIIYAASDSAAKKEEANEQYARDVDKYNKQLEADQQRVEKEEEMKKALQVTYAETDAKVKEAQAIRSHLYAANIVPLKFRNIYAIFSIYDFLSTSQESLESALLHFDLDEIKSKLDTIINQQQEMILQQSVLIAQNESIIRQNREILNHAIKTEKNTARAAQYSQIAAANTEAIAFTNNVLALEVALYNS